MGGGHGRDGVLKQGRHGDDRRTGVSTEEGGVASSTRVRPGTPTLETLRKGSPGSGADLKRVEVWDPTSTDYSTLPRDPHISPPSPSPVETRDSVGPQDPRPKSFQTMNPVPERL